MKKVKETNYKLAISSFNAICTSLPKVTKVTNSRKTAVKRIYEKFSQDDIEKAFHKAQDSIFLRGEVKAQGHENWICTFDWLMKETNMAKVLDGNYDNRGNDDVKEKKEIVNEKHDTQMTMTYEFISPEIAEALLEKNTNNRPISWGSVTKYAEAMKRGHWSPKVGSSISIDENGIIRDGQHRLWAIIESGVGIWTWVCRNVAPDGLYDDNIKRSIRDQLSIINPELESIYKQKKYVSFARWFILQLEGGSGRAVSAYEINDFTTQHKTDLDGYFNNINFGNNARCTTVAAVHIAMFMAYMGGVTMENLNKFYEILCTGMSSSREEFPIITYRNYLLSRPYHKIDKEDILRCQYAISKYLAKSCAAKLYLPKDYIYPIPWKDGQETLNLK